MELEEFQKEIKEGIVLVDFYASWCGPCRMQSPIIDEFAKKHKEVKVLKLDVDLNEEIAKEYGVMSIPNIFVFKNGNMTYSKPGVHNLDSLEILTK